MTEDDAQRWFVERFGTECRDRVARFLAMVVEENARQNLISPGSISTIWARHAVDSAQLVGLAPTDRRWLDVGTGGGFPGMVVALATDRPVTMVEPRKRRAAFLTECVDTFGLGDRVGVLCAKVEYVESRAAVISARAVASVEKLLQATMHCATSETRWILPRGRMTAADIETAQRQSGMVFHVEHSLTDPASVILIVERRA